jgi:hypothetical protein
MPIVVPQLSMRTENGCLNRPRGKFSMTDNLRDMKGNKSGSTEASVCVRWHEPIIAFGVYLGIALAFFSPVWNQLADAMIGEVWDSLQVLWNAWWIQRTLFQGVNPYFSDLIFAPYGTPLVLHFLTPIQSSLIAIVNQFVRIEIAYNVVVLMAFPLAGIGAYTLGRYITQDHVASLVGGLVFMLSPFIVSKAFSGWINMLYAGLLPLFFVTLLKATTPHPGRSSPYLLATTTLLVLLNDVLAVFAANVTVCTLAWRIFASERRYETVGRLCKVLLPSIVVSSPYVVMAAYYIASYGYSLNVGRRLDYIPEIWSYILPFTHTSVYSDRVSDLGFGERIKFDLARVDTAAYLGALVLPLCLAGMIAWLRRPSVRFCAFIFFWFLILSMGPKLLLYREVIMIQGLPIRLPFALWQEIPILGAVAQSGRYLVIPYMMMSVGLACLVATMRNRLGGVRGTAFAIVVALIVCTDYAFKPWTAALPPIPKLSTSAGLVLDPRLRHGTPMYYQTHHQRPLVGGYLSRRPEYALHRYRQIPGFLCLFFGDASAPCERETLLKSLASFGIRDIMLDPADWRNSMLKENGFRRHYADSFTVVWAVPPEATSLP